MVNSKYARSTDLKFNLNRYRIIEMDHSKERAEDNKFIESIKDTLLGKGSWAKRLTRATELMSALPQSDYISSKLKDIGEIVKANSYLNKNHGSSQEYTSFFLRINTLKPSALEYSLSETEYSHNACEETIPPTYKFNQEPKTSFLSALARKGIIDTTVSNPRAPNISEENLNDIISFAIAPEARFKAYEKYKRELRLAEYYASRPMGTRIFEAGKKVAAVLGLAAFAVSSLSFTPMSKNEHEPHIQEEYF